MRTLCVRSQTEPVTGVLARACHRPGARAGGLPAMSGGRGYRMEFDLGSERERPGLERQPGRRLRRIRELPAPPGVEVAVVADVGEQHLHVQEVGRAAAT